MSSKQESFFAGISLAYVVKKKYKRSVAINFQNQDKTVQFYNPI